MTNISKTLTNPERSSKISKTFSLEPIHQNNTNGEKVVYTFIIFGGSNREKQGRIGLKTQIRKRKWRDKYPGAIVADDDVSVVHIVRSCCCCLRLQYWYCFPRLPDFFNQLCVQNAW